MNADPAISGLSLVAEAHEGVVTLQGTAISHAEKQLALMETKHLRGVKEVHDRIDVKPNENQSDAEIAAEVKETIGADVWVDDRLIEVKANDGTVSLIGKVGSAAEKVRATALAWVSGVKSVNADALEVDPELAQKMLATPRRNPTSAQLHETLVAALRRDPRVGSFNVDVNVVGSAVTLSGNVKTLAAKHAAERLARSLVGVSEVHNHLRLLPHTPKPKEDLAADVRAALSRDALLASSDIKVESGAGILTLEGTVDSLYAKSRAEEIASKIEGVVTIADGLKIKAPRPPRYEEGFDLELEKYGFEPEPPPISGSHNDNSIRVEIEKDFRFNPFVHADRIRVDVQNGVATLTGEVSSHHELQAALANARQGGAIGVRNNLHIAPELQP